MEASLSLLSTPTLSHRSSVIFPKLRPPPIPCPRRIATGKFSRRCVSYGGSKLEAEISPEEGEEWMTLGKLKEKCGGRKGVVEFLECLEREAIMGEDEGRDPTDYNRRAKIFSTSSRVFQALKQRNDNEG